MNHHRNILLRCATLAAILVVSSIAELVTPPPAAQAQIPGANMVNAFGNLVGAGARRRGTYIAADQNQRYFNGYYNRLRDTARTQLVSGQLESLRSTQSGLQRVRTGAYIKVYEATRAEQDAVTRAIEAEKNEARRNFNRTLVREVSNLILSTPGAQQILLQVRAVISAVRASVIALQSAMAAGQPTNLIREQLANQVRDSSHAQNLVRNLGTMVGQSLDQAMGGALTRVDNALIRSQEEMATAAAGLDQMDSQVAALSTERSNVVSGDSTGLGSDIHISDSTMAVLDAASSALGFITAIQGGRGTTRQQMYQQIRYEMLVAHNRHLLQAAENVSQVECREVSRSDYEAALGALNESPQTDGATENPTYFVCYDRDSGEPVGAWIGRVSLPTETPAPTTSAQAAGSTATRTSSETRWTLQEADAASYLTFATRVTSSYSNQMEAACYGEIMITNSLNEIVVGECEDYHTLYDEGVGHRRISRINFHGPETITHYAGWRTSTLGYETEYYMIRCVAYRNSDAQGYPIPGRWISEAYPENGSLIESGLTVITVPNPCAR